MTNKIFSLLLVMGLFVNFGFSQEEEVIEVSTENSALMMTDEMTVNADQNKEWRMGQYQYSAKPKNAWELGLHFGHFFIDGDVDRTLPGGFGLGLHLRKAIHYAFSLRGDLFYGVATGLDPQYWSHRNQAKTAGAGGGLVEPTFNMYDPNDGSPADWFPKHKTTQIYGAIQGVINIGNILFHDSQNKWNWYLTLGTGFSNHTAKLNLLDENNLPYEDLVSRTGWTLEKLNTKSGRSEIKDAVNGIYDDTYETEGFKKDGIFRIGDETNIHVIFTGSMGVARKINKRFNIGLEHQVMLQDNDYIDGIKFRTSEDQTNNADLEHYTNIRLAMNLGSFDKVSEPLYWLNPLDAAMNDIAELKQRPELDLTDEDGDGIIDMLDQELDTQEGFPVDTRGVTLDSDNDGIPDGLDKEPYSPPGFVVDAKGVAEIPEVPCCVTEEDITKIFDAKSATLVKSGCGEWFLPMIHFDLGKSYVKPEFYGQLHHVATVMQMCPDICVVAQGHTDSRNNNDFNNVLSYKRSQAAIDYLTSNYGIDRSRLKLMYGGEDSPLVKGSSKEGQHYMNRRVEFKLCGSGDFDMAMPEGTSVGSGATKRTGSQYNGNKSSGY